MQCHFDPSSSMDDDDDDEFSETMAWLGRVDFQFFRLLSPLGRLTTRLARQASRKKGA